MTAIVLTFHNKQSYYQASDEASRRGFQCHGFPVGVTQGQNASFYRKWLIKNLPTVMPANSVMVVPLTHSTREQAPDILCDLALSVDEPESVTGYVICDE